MENGLRRYYIQAPITDPPAVKRIQQYADRVNGLYGVDCTVQDKRHITIVPPFFASNEQAMVIDRMCKDARRFPNHPLKRTQFSIQKMAVREQGGLDVIHFPVKVHLTGVDAFADYVTSMRKTIAQLGVKFVDELPLYFTPRVTLFAQKDASKKRGFQKIITSSGIDPFLIFKCKLPALMVMHELDGYIPFSYTSQETK